MTVKRIGNLERVLISECVKDTPDFGCISKLFDMGADINAVNEFGECVAAIVFEGYCSLYGGNLRSGYYVPALISMFVKQGFDVKRHGLKTVSELQNCCYDKYVRKGIAMILDIRRRQLKQNREKALKTLSTICRKLTQPRVA